MSCKQNSDIMERLYEQAEILVDEGIDKNTSIPEEARNQLIQEEYQNLWESYSDVYDESDEAYWEYLRKGEE